MCDSTGRVYVAAPARPLLPIRPGSEIDIEGVSAPGNFAPIVDRPAIRVTGSYRRLPETLRVGPSQLRTGTYDCAWVEIEGLVRRVREIGHNVTLDVDSGGSLVSATTVREPGADYGRLLDADVRIRGTAAPLYIGNHLIAGGRVFFQTLAQVRIVEAGPADPFALPAIQAASVLWYMPDRTYPHRVHVLGQVTLYWPGRTLCIEDQSGGLCVRTAQRSRIETVDLVDVVGFPSNEDSPALSDASFRWAGRGAAPAPRSITAEQAFGTDYDARLVQIEGRLIGQGHSANDRALLLSSGHSLFVVILPRDSSGSDTQTLGEFPQEVSALVLSRDSADKEKQRFDLVMMDVQMPEMDGFEATATIRARESTTGAHIPIIALTAHAMAGDRQRCLDAGMDGYVSNPIHAEELLEAIERLLPVAA